MSNDPDTIPVLKYSKNDPYLAKTLVEQGEVLLNYYSAAGGSLANEIALVSGQGPTPNNVNNCPVYTDVVPGDAGPGGQVLGPGACIRPPPRRSPTR